MTLRHYFPLSVGFFLLVVVGAYAVSFPVLPFAVILLIGETVLGCEMEDHKIPRFLQALAKSMKSGQHPKS